MSEEPPFPFLFFGARPDEWFEAANFGHPFAVRFRAPPDEAARRALAHAFERATAETTCVDGAGDDWSWAGRWTMLSFGERRDGIRDLGWSWFFEEVADVLRALHAVWPIAEGVNFNVDGPPGTDPWQVWTEAQQALPSPGPAWPDIGPRRLDWYGSRHVRMAGPIATDPVFEAERRAIRETLEEQRARREDAEEAGAVAAGRIVLRASSPPEPRGVPFPLKPRRWAAMGPGEHALVLEPVKQGYVVHVSSASGERRVTPKLAAPSFRYAFSADGARLWLVSVDAHGRGSHDVVEVDCAAGTARTVLTYPGPITALDGAGGLLLVGGPGLPVWAFDPRAALIGAPVWVVDDPFGATALGGLADGRLVFWSRPVGIGASATVLFVRDDDGFRLVAQSDLRLSTMWVQDGHTWARDDRGRTFEVLNLDRAMAIALAGPAVDVLRIDDDQPGDGAIFVASGEEG